MSSAPSRACSHSNHIRILQGKESAFCKNTVDKLPCKPCRPSAALQGEAFCQQLKLVMRHIYAKLCRKLADDIQISLLVRLLEGDVQAKIYHLSENPVTWEVSALYREGCYIGEVEQALLDITSRVMKSHKN